MKIILSRKGFDSAAGGIPSPILPDGTLLSMPIPDRFNGPTCYEHLHLPEGQSYLEVLTQLTETIRMGRHRVSVSEGIGCHLDPDLLVGARTERPGERAAFGQMQAAQRHLELQGIEPGDVFLFFGWFRQTWRVNGRLAFEPKAPDLHVIFGFLQVDLILTPGTNAAEEEPFAYHPHVVHARKEDPTNRLYVAREQLSLDGKLPGSGTFRHQDALVLTSPGQSRSRWRLPQCLQDVDISYHSPASRKPGYFQSAARGQEFVVQADAQIERWVLHTVRQGLHIDRPA